MNNNETPDGTKAARATVVRATVQGTVTSVKMKDTIVVREQRMVKHPRYHKYVRRHTKYHAHDLGNTANEGDEVEIIQTRPMSKTKNWRLLRILRRGQGGLAHADTDAGASEAAAEASAANAAGSNA